MSLLSRDLSDELPKDESKDNFCLCHEFQKQKAKWNSLSRSRSGQPLWRAAAESCKRAHVL